MASDGIVHTDVGMLRCDWCGESILFDAMAVDTLGRRYCPRCGKAVDPIRYGWRHIRCPGIV